MPSGSSSRAGADAAKTASAAKAQKKAAASASEAPAKPAKGKGGARKAEGDVDDTQQQKARSALSALSALADRLEEEVGERCKQRMRAIDQSEAEFWNTCRFPPNQVDDRTAVHPYQIDGVRFLSAMYDCGMGAILGDDMGLGKTMQTVLFILRLRKVGVKGPVLILAPAALLQQWKSEFELWCKVLGLPAPPVVVIHGKMSGEGLASERKGQDQATSQAAEARRAWFDAMVAHADQHDGEWPIVITSHGLFQNSSEAAYLSNLPRLAAKPLEHWALTVVDEAHVAKNSKTQIFTSLENFKTRTFLLLTGTIIHNNLDRELIALLNFILPPVLREYDLLSCLIAGRRNLWDPKTDRPTPQLLHLRRILFVFLMRRTVQSKVVQHIKMQPRARCVIVLPKSPLQDKVYGDLAKVDDDLKSTAAAAPDQRLQRKKVAGGAEEGEFLSAKMPPRVFLELLTDKHPFLLQMIFDPDNLPDPLPALDKFPDRPLNSSRARSFMDLVCSSSYKIILLMKLLNSLTQKGHRTLVFSQSIPVLNMLSIILHLNKYPHDLITGSTHFDERVARVQRFNQPTNADDVKHILLLSTRAMGQGVNLAGADTEIFFDHDWNPQQDNQAESRSYRVNQTRPVLVIHLLTAGSAERSRFRGILQEKRKMQHWFEHTSVLERERTKDDPVIPDHELPPIKCSDYEETLQRLLHNRQAWTANETSRVLQLTWLPNPKIPSDATLFTSVLRE